MTKFFFGCLGLLLLMASAMGQQYPISGSFLMFDREMPQDAWERELSQMRAIGQDTVVVLSVGRLNGTQSSGSSCTSLSASGLLYPSSLVSNPPSNDRLDMLLALADRLVMKVYVGSLQTAGDWTSGVEFSTLRTCNKAVVSEIVSRYGGHASLAGFYFTQELWLNWVKYYGPTYYGISLVGNFVTDVATITTRPVFTAPVFKKNPVGSMPGLTATETGQYLGVLLSGSKLKLVAPQDGIGAQAGAPSVAEIGQYFSAMKSVANANHSELWSVLETFVNNGGPQDQYPPASFSRIKLQATAELPNVSKVIQWMFGHDMSGRATYHPVASQALFDQYKGYYGLNSVSIPARIDRYVWSEDPASAWADASGNKLTDGQGGGYGNNAAWVGLNDVSGYVKRLTIFLSPGQSISQVRGVRLLARSEMGSWIAFPQHVSAYSCLDSWSMQRCSLFASANFTALPNAQSYLVEWLALSGTPSMGDHIELEISHVGWLMLAEVQVLFSADYQ